MNIGFDAKRLFCNFTGLGNYSRTLLRNLEQFFPDNDYFLYTTKVNEVPETIQFLENPELNIRISEALIKSFWRTWTIKNQLIKDQVDIYHGLNQEIPVDMHKTGIKTVVTIHDLIFKVHPETYSRIDRKIYDLKSRYACTHADRIIAISQNTKNDITSLYNIDSEKIDVIHQACNPIFYKLQRQHEVDRISKLYDLPGDYLLSVGSIEPRKNLKRVIEGLSWLKRDLLIPLVIVGKGGKYKVETEQLVRQSGLKNMVIWINGLDNNDHLQALYQNARALIYPSLYEGFGLPVVEALLSKTPVITSGRSSLKEAGGPGSLYINPLDPEQIAAAIEKILTDDSFRNNMINIGYGYAHQYFAPDKVTNQVMDCYRKTMTP